MHRVRTISLAVLNCKINIMLKTKKTILLISCSFFLNSCCLLFPDGCDDCEDVVEGAEQADLLFNSFRGEPKEESSGEKFFEVVQTILNIAQDYDCPEEVDSAGAHSDELQLIFYEDSDVNFSNPEIVGSKSARINKTTHPDETYELINELVFEKIGVYGLESTIDSKNEVEERDEANNFKSKGGPSSKRNKPNLDQLIYVTKDMLGGKKGNKNKYISRWDVRVNY